MKKKITMTCLFKSGVEITATIKVDKKDNKAKSTIRQMQQEIEKYLGSSNSEAGQITWGTTIINLSEVAAIKFKEKYLW